MLNLRGTEVLNPFVPELIAQYSVQHTGIQMRAE